MSLCKSYVTSPYFIKFYFFPLLYYIMIYHFRQCVFTRNFVSYRFSSLSINILCIFSVSSRVFCTFLLCIFPIIADFMHDYFSFLQNTAESPGNRTLAPKQSYFIRFLFPWMNFPVKSQFPPQAAENQKAPCTFHTKCFMSVFCHRILFLLFHSTLGKFISPP